MRVVHDNHYGLRFDRPTPNFIIQEITHCFTMRIIFSDKSPIVPGIHYLVEHTHAHKITNTTDLKLLHHLVCWDLTMLTKIFNSIPLQHKKACDILSKEIATEMSFKTYIEQQLFILQLHLPQLPSHPPVSSLNLTSEEQALLDKDIPQLSQDAFFS